MNDRTDVTVRVVACEGRKYLMLRWTDPKSGRPAQQSAKTNNRRQAERMARDLEAAFVDGTAAACLWDVFCDRYEREHLSMLSAGSLKAWRTIRRKIDTVVKPRYLRELDADAIAQLVGAMRTGYVDAAGAAVPGIRVTSIDSYLGQLAAALGWAKDPANLLKELPRFPKLPRAKGRSKLARSRPITLEELDRIILACESVRKKCGDAKQWQSFLRGLAESGLRLHELMRLSWDFGEGIWIDTSGRYPMIRISSSAEKAHTDRMQPITPQFWKLLQPAKPTGLALPLLGEDGLPYGKDWVTHVISKIGRKAGVLTNPEDKKCATSHDIGRRFFATRMATIMPSLELKAWMRHESIETTETYYAEMEAYALAGRFWGDTHGDTALATDVA